MYETPEILGSFDARALLGEALGTDGSATGIG